MEECVFCRVSKKKTATEFVYEDEEIMVFPDINPSAPIHLLIVPKEHIEDLLSKEMEEGKIWEKMTRIAKSLVRKNKLKGYRLVLNGGEAKMINHLHLHLLGEISAQKSL